MIYPPTSLLPPGTLGGLTKQADYVKYVQGQVQPPHDPRGALCYYPEEGKYEV